MKSPVAHWGAREWRKSMDDLVPDPAPPLLWFLVLRVRRRRWRRAKQFVDDLTG